MVKALNARLYLAQSGEFTPIEPVKGIAVLTATEPPKLRPLNSSVTLTQSGESGVIIGRAVYLDASRPQYLIRYRSGDGRLVEVWWSESAIDDQASERAEPTPLVLPRALGDEVQLLMSEREAGPVVAAAEYADDAPRFLVRYADWHGSQLEKWWPLSALKGPEGLARVTENTTFWR